MNWVKVVRYRMRFDPITQLGDILVDHVDDSNERSTTALESVNAPSFAAIAALLGNSKQRLLLFDGQLFYSGPEPLRRD
jgi:hypothetical protein